MKKTNLSKIILKPADVQPLIKRIIDNKIGGIYQQLEFKEVFATRHAEIVIPSFSMSRFYECVLNDKLVFVKLCFYWRSQYELITGIISTIHQHELDLFILLHFHDLLTKTMISPCIATLHGAITYDAIKEITAFTDCEIMNRTEELEDMDDILQWDLCRYKSAVNSNISRNKLTFSIMENYTQSFDDVILDIIKSPISIPIFQALLFQILYTLACINDIYPKFLHNDLHLGNILIYTNEDYKLDINTPAVQVFNYKGKKFYVPYFGMTPKLIDFAFADIPSLGISSDILLEKKIIWNMPLNDVVDLFYKINSTICESYHIQDANNRINTDYSGNIYDILVKLEPNKIWLLRNPDIVRTCTSTRTCEDMILSDVYKTYQKKIPCTKWGAFSYLPDQ
jgi:hypothetical protein